MMPNGMNLNSFSFCSCCWRRRSRSAMRACVFLVCSDIVLLSAAHYSTFSNRAHAPNGVFCLRDQRAPAQIIRQIKARAITVHPAWQIARRCASNFCGPAAHGGYPKGGFSRNRAYTGQSRPSATGFNRRRSVSLRVAAISIARVRTALDTRNDFGYTPARN